MYYLPFIGNTVVVTMLVRMKPWHSVQDTIFMILDVEQDCPHGSSFLMNSGLFVLECQRIRRITAGYEHIIMVSQQDGDKLSPSVFRRLLNCCPMAQTSAGPKCSAVDLRGGIINATENLNVNRNF